MSVDVLLNQSIMGLLTIHAWRKAGLGWSHEAQEHPARGTWDIPGALPALSSPTLPWGLRH